MTDPYEELMKPSPLLDRLKRANPLLQLSASGPPTAVFPLGWSQNQDGNVVITMTPDDWERLLMQLGIAAGSVGSNARLRSLALLNRLNAGNPNYTPYQQVEPETTHG